MPTIDPKTGFGCPTSYDNGVRRLFCKHTVENIPPSHEGYTVTFVE